MLKQRKRRRIIKKIMLVVILLMISLLAGILAIQILWKKTIPVNREMILPFLERAISNEEAESYFYYSLLKENEQKAYREILAGLEAGRDEIYVHLSNPDQGNRVYQYVYMDHPEFFWCDGSSRTTSYTVPETYSVIMPGYTCSGEERARRKVEIDTESEVWLAQIVPELSEYEKIKQVYEKIINSVEYRVDAPENQNIYSVFVGHESVCAGYARATQYLLNRLGIFCTYVTGEVYTGEAHAWNLVKCDGEYYYVDTPYPACTADTYDYYKRNGMYYETADAELLERILQSSIEEKEDKVVMKFREDAVYEEARQILFGGLLEAQAQYLGRWYGLNQIHYYYREDVDNLLAV